MRRALVCIAVLGTASQLSLESSAIIRTIADTSYVFSRRQNLRRLCAVFRVEQSRTSRVLAILRLTGETELQEGSICAHRRWGTIDSRWLLEHHAISLPNFVTVELALASSKQLARLLDGLLVGHDVVKWLNARDMAAFRKIAPHGGRYSDSEAVPYLAGFPSDFG
jgi:hypothetical protein